MRRRERLAVVAVVAFAAGFAFLHPDWYPALSAYGVTVGTGTHYCPADVVHGSIMLSCEHAS